MVDVAKIEDKALENYVDYTGEEDFWHNQVEKVLFPFVSKRIKKYTNKDSVILNAGSGGETYFCDAKLIHLDIVDTNIKQFPHHIVASVTDIPLEDNSIDMIICVGSVLNYTDVSKALDEFKRVLKPNGKLILEFERSDSLDLKHSNKHHADMCEQTYEYDGKEHTLIMYGEKYIKSLVKSKGFDINKKKRFHIFSTLLTSLKVSEDKAAKYQKLDFLLKPISYGIAHNVIMVLTKKE